MFSYQQVSRNIFDLTAMTLLIYFAATSKISYVSLTGGLITASDDDTTVIAIP